MLPNSFTRAFGALVCAIAAAECVFASTGIHDVEYVLDLPARRPISYTIEFAVEHPGSLELLAEWGGTRVLSLKLDGPGGVMLRRSGPPPLRFDLDVEPEQVAAGEPWTLSVRGLAFGTEGRGRVLLWLPRPESEEAPLPESLPEPEDAEPPPAWLLPQESPADAAEEIERLYSATERLRAHVTTQGDEARDRYGWQETLLAHLASLRDGEAPMPDQATLDLLVRTVEATRGVERIATSTDPLIAGPVPTQPGRRKAWLLVRAERIRPIESELDLLLYDVTRRDPAKGEAPPWLPRLVSSLMACERHFEQRPRLGARAAHAEVVAEQWDGLRIAADALDSLVRATAAD